MPKKKTVRPFIMTVEPDRKDIVSFVDDVKKQTGLSKRRIVTEMLDRAIQSGLFSRG